MYRVELLKIYRDVYEATQTTKFVFLPILGIVCDESRTVSHDRVLDQTQTIAVYTKINYPSVGYEEVISFQRIHVQK